MITHSCPNFSGSFAGIEFKTWMNNYIPYETVDVITCPCHNPGDGSDSTNEVFHRIFLTEENVCILRLLLMCMCPMNLGCHLFYLYFSLEMEIESQWINYCSYTPFWSSLCFLFIHLGAIWIGRCYLTSIKILIIKIRPSHYWFIFIMRISKP